MALRVRLVLILVVLVTVAVGAIEAITFAKIHSTLVSNVDSQLQGSVAPLRLYFVALSEGQGDRSLFQTVQPHTYAALYDTSGHLIDFPPNDQGLSNPDADCPNVCNARPVLPRDYVANVAASVPLGQSQYVTVRGTSGTRSFRVLATVAQDTAGNGLILIVAFPLTAVDSTMSKVLGLELVIGALLLVTIAVVSWFLVKLGFRPLERMATTASEIAAGDLTKRIEDTDTRTEVGQLGAALNVMLTQIERAFRERQASEDQLRQFVADASHELRTPLTSIRGYAELFKTGVADRPEDLAAALRRIESESVRMGGLVDDLLLLARLDQGRPLSHDLVDLAILASDAVRDAGAVDPSRMVVLTADERCSVVGDEQRLRQVLANLVSNALAYSPAGAPVEVFVRRAEGPAGAEGAPVAASTSRSSGAGAVAPPLGPADFAAGSKADGSPAAGGPPPWRGASVAVAVVDHGAGIPPANAPHVFERFWRGDASRRRAGGGTGLGLSIVAAVVAAHSGRVTVLDTPGGGATFVVELPAVPVPPPTKAATAPIGTERQPQD